MTKHDKYFWIAVLSVITGVYFFGLSVPLLGPDESRYTQIAREMYERGDWITPKLGGFDWFEKPALLYWLQIVSFKMFGISEFAARFGSAIFGLGTAFSLWLIGRQWSRNNSDTAEDPATANFANWLVLISASSIGMLAFSRGASFDIILTFPITASLAGFFIFDQSANRSGFRYYFPLFAFYFFIGVALIAKGLVGAVFPFAIVAFYFVLSWKFPNRAFVISLIWGTVVALIVALVWYLPMYQVNGWKFVDEFFIQHHFQRYSSNKYQHPQPFWFFWIVLPLMTIPWLPFFLGGIGKFFKNAFQRQGKNDDANASVRNFLPVSSSPLLRFSFCWMLVPLVFFSISGSKLPGYILPVLPAAMIFTAHYAYDFARRSKFRTLSLKCLGIGTFLVVAVVIQFALPKFAGADSTKPLLQAADDSGHTTEKVVNLHTISHNSEFYFSGRLFRAADGKIRKFLGVPEIAEQLKSGSGDGLLVLVPHEYLHELTGSDLVNSTVLKENGELVIVYVRLR